MIDLNKTTEPFQKKIRSGTIPPEAKSEQDLPLSSVFTFDKPDGNANPTIYVQDGWDFSFNSVNIDTATIGTAFVFSEYTSDPDTVDDSAVLKPAYIGGSYYLRVNFNGTIRSVELT